MNNLIIEHYRAANERDRLAEDEGLIEKLRSQEIISRYLSRPGLRIADIGSGPGEYSLWLAGLGHRVTALDFVPEHIEMVRQRGDDAGLVFEACVVAGALETGLPTAGYDLVLLMGPLYHLIRREDRLQALREALRLLRPGGVACCAGISRYASLISGHLLGAMDDPDFQAIVEQDLATGVHENKTGKDYFTEAFFHAPEQLEEELCEAGFQCEALIGIEGFSWFMAGRDEALADAERRRRLLDDLKQVESERNLLGVSAHLMAVGRKALD
jgi:SAM-dependent methyltransferase